MVPDWVCEILSPSTAGKIREIKLPLHAHYGVPSAWLVDPKARTLEALKLEAGAYRGIGRFAEAERRAIPPFEAVSLDLGDLWLGWLSPVARVDALPRRRLFQRNLRRQPALNTPDGGSVPAVGGDLAEDSSADAMRDHLRSVRQYRHRSGLERYRPWSPGNAAD